MRILYDHQVFSLQNAGGASRYHYELVRYLASQPEAQVRLLVGWNRTMYPLTELKAEQVKVLSWNTPLGPGLLRYVANEAVTNVAALAGGAVDVYHPTLYRGMPGVRARRMIVTHHDCVHERFPHLFADVKKVLRAKQRLYAQADGIICNSESSRQDLLKFYPVDTARTRVIYHGLEPLRPRAGSAGELRRQVRREYLLFVGMRPAYKNFNRLLEAFAASGLHRSMDLLVLGGGRLTVEERSLADKLHISDALISIPGATDELLAEAYAGAKLFVYPSLCEGFGFPPLEAMAAGCPVAVSRTSSLPEVCGDAPWYFDPEDGASMQQALLAAVNDDGWRKAAIARGLAVVARYSWRKCGEQTLAFYRQSL